MSSLRGSTVLGNPVPVPNPSWIDPGLLLCALQQTDRVVTLEAGIPTQVLDADPERAAFVVVKSFTLPSFPRLSPFPDVSKFSTLGVAGQTVGTFLLQDWLTLITNEWFALSGSTGDILIYEFRTR